jgi:chromate reductase, NAD(P)H dehydrogenase (quinone)
MQLDSDNRSQLVRILAISGSLRQVSSNTTLLHAAIALSPAAVEMRLYRGLGDLPHFNPDLEPDIPPVVMDLKQQVAWCDGLLISSPEYAHGVPGVLKNALDWLVSGFEFIDKPMALFNASPHAIHAQAALTEIVTVMSGKIVPEACIAVPLPGRNLDVEGIVAEPEISSQIQAALVTFASEIDQFRTTRIEDLNIK